MFFSGHLLLIFLRGIWTTIDGYRSCHYNERPYIPVLSFLKENRIIRCYAMLSGTNTGYGFYGIKASTEKYFKVTLFDSADSVLLSDRYFISFQVLQRCWILVGGMAVLFGAPLQQ